MLIVIPFIILRVFMPYDQLPFNFVLSMIGYVVAASGCYTAIIYFIVRRTLLNPINKLNEAARRITAGDFSVYIEPEHTINRLSELDELISSINIMVDELDSNEMMKRDFISNVSHEIKTPLAVIQNCCFALQQEDLSPGQQREYTEVIIQSSKRLNTLVGNILKLNKLENQEIKPDKQPYDFCEQLSDCILLFESVIDDRAIRLNAGLQERTTIQADRELLDIVWTNLLSNAFKFTEPGGSISVVQAADDTHYYVTVSDSGCGMDDKTKRRLFEKFYQGDTSHAKEGNSLGMALVYRILQMSDGTIEVESELGKGSSIKVRIPKE